MEKVISIGKQNFASLRENHYHSYKKWKGDFYLWQLQRQKQNMDRFMAVSYTHLDVYKRQAESILLEYHDFSDNSNTSVGHEHDTDQRTVRRPDLSWYSR